MYNLIVTSYRNESRHLMRELSKLGKFRTTKFRDVLTGEVVDVKEFLKTVSDEPPLSLARVVPVLEVIEFKEPDELLKTLKKKLLIYDFKGSFKMVVDRRGFKGVINSQEWAQELGALIHEGKGNEVNLTDPDVYFMVSIMSDTCAISLLDRAMRDEFFFVKTK